jgi:hypothetical protein
MAIQPFAMQGVTPNIMLPSEALYNAGKAKSIEKENMMVNQQMAEQSKLDQLYRESGGDINKMMQNPNLGFNAGTKLQAISSENVKAANAAKVGQLDFMLKGAEYSAQLAGSVKDQAGWDQVRQHLGETLGEQALAQLPEQYSPEAAQKVYENALSFKDRMQLQQQDLAERRMAQQAMQQDRMYDATMARIDASERNAERRAADGGGGGKMPSKVQEAEYYASTVAEKGTPEYQRAVSKYMGGGVAGSEKAPAGFENITDDQGRVIEQRPIVGSKQYRVDSDKHANDFAVLDATKSGTAALNTKIDNLLRNEEGLKGATGLRGAIPNIPGSDAAKAEIAIAELRDAIQMEGMSRMRSTAGSAGSMTEREWPKLEAKLQRLDTAQGYDEIVKAAKEVREGLKEFDSLAERKYNTEWAGSQYQKNAPPPPDTGAPKDFSKYHK